MAYDWYPSALQYSIYSFAGNCPNNCFLVQNPDDSIGNDTTAYMTTRRDPGLPSNCGCACAGESRYLGYYDLGQLVSTDGTAIEVEILRRTVLGIGAGSWWVRIWKSASGEDFDDPLLNNWFLVAAISKLAPDDVDFVWVGGNAGAGTNLRWVRVELTMSCGAFAADYIYDLRRVKVVSDSTPPPGPPPPPGQSLNLRLIDMDSDSKNLYLTSCDDSILTMRTYDLETLAFQYDVECGGATYAELDARDRGIFPVVKPGEDVVFLRGRDGNNVKVQYSDDYGVSLTAVDDGGWSAAKYACCLLPDPLVPDDTVVVFDDNDIYRSENAGEDWMKTADAPVNQREQARDMLAESNLILAGQGAGAGELDFTPNYGDTTEDISDAGIGTVNHVERSL